MQLHFNDAQHEAAAFSRHSDPVEFLLFHAEIRWSRLLSWSDMKIVFQLPADAMHRMCNERWSIEQGEREEKREENELKQNEIRFHHPHPHSNTLNFYEYIFRKGDDIAFLSLSSLDTLRLTSEL